MNHSTDANSATRNGDFDGFCCRAKIRPPIEGTSSLAAAAVAILRGGWPAARRERVTGRDAGAPRASSGSAGFLSSILGSGDLRSDILRCSALKRSASDNLRSTSAAPPPSGSSSRNLASSPGSLPVLSEADVSVFVPVSAPTGGDFACSCAITRPSHKQTLRKLAPRTHTPPAAARASCRIKLSSGLILYRKRPRNAFSPAPLSLTNF